MKYFTIVICLFSFYIQVRSKEGSTQYSFNKENKEELTASSSFNNDQYYAHDTSDDFKNFNSDSFGESEQSEGFKLSEQDVKHISNNFKQNNEDYSFSEGLKLNSNSDIDDYKFGKHEFTFDNHKFPKEGILLQGQNLNQDTFPSEGYFSHDPSNLKEYNPGSNQFNTNKYTGDLTHFNHNYKESIPSDDVKYFQSGKGKFIAIPKIKSYQLKPYSTPTYNIGRPFYSKPYMKTYPVKHVQYRAPKHYSYIKHIPKTIYSSPPTHIWHKPSKPQWKSPKLVDSPKFEVLNSANGPKFEALTANPDFESSAHHQIDPWQIAKEPQTESWNYPKDTHFESWKTGKEHEHLFPQSFYKPMSKPVIKYTNTQRLNSIARKPASGHGLFNRPKYSSPHYQPEYSNLVSSGYKTYSGFKPSFNFAQESGFDSNHKYHTSPQQYQPNSPNFDQTHQFGPQFFNNDKKRLLFADSKELHSLFSGGQDGHQQKIMNDYKFGTPHSFSEKEVDSNFSSLLEMIQNPKNSNSDNKAIYLIGKPGTDFNSLPNLAQYQGFPSQFTNYKH